MTDTDLDFQSRVRELIPENHERDSMFEALRRYKSNQNLAQLLSVMRLLLSDPSRLELYGTLRPLILVRHQLEYSCRVPGTPRSKFRIVRLRRHVGENLGFCLKGGYEHGVGVFVTDVTHGSQAYRQGLKVGDELIRVNGFTISEAVHEEVLNLIRMNDEVILKVTHVGMVPVKDCSEGSVIWEYVEEDMQDDVALLAHPKDLKLFMDTTAHSSFGCGIRSGPRSFPGIFIERVQAESLAYELGLETGDQIKEVNGTSFRKITHNEAVLALKGSRQLNMVIRKKTGLRLFNENTNTIYSTLSAPSESYSQPRIADLSISGSSISEQRASPQGLDMAIDPSQIDTEDPHQVYSRPGVKKRAPSPPYKEPTNNGFMTTSAEVHSQDEVSRLRASPFGTQAYTAQHRNQLSVAKPLEDFEWSDKVSVNIYSKFSAEVLDGRQLKCLAFKKSQDLGVEVEGGIGSPLGGKIVVATVFENGVGHHSGILHVGDQLMMVSGQSLVNVTMATAERILHNTDIIPGDTVELIYCESTFINDEDSVTYF